MITISALSGEKKKGYKIPTTHTHAHTYPYNWGEEEGSTVSRLFFKDKRKKTIKSEINKSEEINRQQQQQHLT